MVLAGCQSKRNGQQNTAGLCQRGIYQAYGRMSPLGSPQERPAGRKSGEQNRRDKDSKNRDQEMSNKGALFGAVSFFVCPGDSYCPQCAYFGS